MRLFIDTEFVSFNCPLEGLISLGCVTDQDSRWYGVHRDYPLDWCSPFVLDHVRPYLLDHPPQVVAALPILGGALHEWIEALDEEVIAVVDYSGDWFFLVDLLHHAECWPRNLAKQPEYIYSDLSEALLGKDGGTDGFITRFMAEHGLSRHNALSDALANKAMWVAMR